MARPLRDLFAELTGSGVGSAGADPESLLAAAGHPDLPAGLVAEAVVSYAGTAPAEVAEHLAPFVVAHSPVPADPAGPADAEPGSWLGVLASAPDVLDSDPAGTGDLDLDAGASPVAHRDADGADAGAGHDPFGLDFGGGAGGLDHEVVGLDHDPVDVDHAATGFGGGAGGADLATADDGTAGHGVVGQPYLDDLVPLDHVDGATGLGHGEQPGTDPNTVDGDAADGE